MEDKKKGNSDRWSDDGKTFICDDNGYCVAPTGANVCIGPVDYVGKPLTNGYNTPEASPDAEKDVAKLPSSKELPTADIQEQNGDSYATLKHPGGRPRKEGPVHRSNDYRRRITDQQLVLIK